MRILRFSLFSIILAGMLTQLSAKENINVPTGNKTKQNNANSLRAAGCDPATSQIDLDINNVRARLLNGGDMWWDLSTGRYEVPKDGGVSSLFAGSVWIGGVDAGGQLKVAAQTYRQSGNDFFPGPLDANGSIDKTTCSAWDQHFKVTATEIETFKTDFLNGVTNNIPTSILEWPATGNTYSPIVGTYVVNAFHDEDQDGLYDPYMGDHPILDVESATEIVPDQLIWWVYNDKGNIHSETGSDAIGIEIQSAAFAFKTNDEVNDMTFYRYRITNKSSLTLDSTFMAQWVDADLGAYNDDYVGCDTSRALGVCYNGDAVDGPTSPNYGDEPPLVGVDFFEGPKDTSGNELGMAVFLYYNNDFTIIGNPETAPHYYGYMTGTWKDGTPFTEGGNGYGGSVLSNYVFPGDPSDAAGWSECTQGNTPADRRFLQSAGPFTLLPGAVNNITIGVVWVRPKNVYPCPSFKALQIASDKAQALFDNSFKLMEGPKAPEVTFRELDREIILSITATDETESYEETSPTIKALMVNDPTITDSTYNFQGYIVYQLSDASVSSSELDDRSKARIVASVDIKDGIGPLVNYSYNADLNYNLPEVKAENAEDNGIRHTFNIKQSLFATGDKKLINYKKYYFTVVPYSHNNFKTYDAADPDALDGQQVPYLEARKFKISPPYVVVPHKADVQDGFSTLNSTYGDGPEIVRIEGHGNGGNNIELTQESIDDILENGFTANPKYVGGSGPVNVKVYDPVKVPKSDFELRIVDPDVNNYTLAADSRWYIINLTTGDTTHSDTTLSTINEQVFPELGLSIQINQIDNPGALDADAKPIHETNGLMSAEVIYSDLSDPWLSGVSDGESYSPRNWIKSGSYTDDTYTEVSDYDDGTNFLDPDADFESITGSWAPFCLANHTPYVDFPYGKQAVLAPGYSDPLSFRNSLDRVYSVDIVFTPDQSKWSRVLVLESSDDRVLSEDGETNKFEVRQFSGLDQDGNAGQPIGTSYFPGYAINIETGERLNMMFSEDSWLIGDNGRDMTWNPSSNLLNNQYEIKAGGKHYVYVLRTPYDENKINSYYKDNLSFSSTAPATIMRDFMWVGVPLLDPGSSLKSMADGLVPNEVKVRLRVNRGYSVGKYAADHNGEYEGAYNSSETVQQPPVYQFSTHDLAPDTAQASISDSIMDLINVVPNPYYAYSNYETSQIDNRIKITNLPSVCTISIYSVNGTLIRKFDRGVASNTSVGDNDLDSSLEWDLKNHKGIMVSSGVYLIHVKVPDHGERIIKFFGVMRPIDLDTF